MYIEMHDKAEEVMRNAIAEIPDCAQLYSSLGVFLGKQNRLEVHYIYRTKQIPLLNWLVKKEQKEDCTNVDQAS